MYILLRNEELHRSHCFQRTNAYSSNHVAVISGALPVSIMAAVVTYTSPEVSRPVVRVLGMSEEGPPPPTHLHTPIKVVPFVFVHLVSTDFLLIKEFCC